MSEAPICLKLKYETYVKNMRMKERIVPDNEYDVIPPGTFCPRGCDYTAYVRETVVDGEVKGVVLGSKGTCKYGN